MVAGYGRLAQLVRAIPLQGIGRRFESVTAHQTTKNQELPNVKLWKAVALKLTGATVSILEFFDSQLGPLRPKLLRLSNQLPTEVKSLIVGTVRFKNGVSFWLA